MEATKYPGIKIPEIRQRESEHEGDDENTERVLEVKKMQFADDTNAMTTNCRHVWQIDATMEYFCAAITARQNQSKREMMVMVCECHLSNRCAGAMGLYLHKS